jgi:hypothetical protein
MYEMKEKSSFRTGERKCKGSRFSSPWLKKSLTAAVSSWLSARQRRGRGADGGHRCRCP